MSIRYIRHIFISCGAVVCLLVHSAYGDYRDVTTRINVNEQTDLFEKSTDDYSVLQKQIQSQTEAGLESVRSGGGMEYLAKESREEIEQNASELSGIKATELNSRGTEEMVKQNVIDELYIDYTKPLNKQMLVDAKKIAKGQEELMHNLLAKLQDIGVDCKTTKGLVEQEPTYYLKLEQTQHKDTVYNKTICEELRNIYQCNDSVALTCKTKAMQWDDWQYREVKIAGDTVYHGAKHLGHAIFWKKKRWGWHLNFDSAGWRVFLSNHLKIPLEQIGEQIFFPGGARGVDGNHPVYEEWRIVFNAYLFGYNYRDGKEICTEWAEDWTERCRLQ
jgi:hypothetical protein